MNFQSLPLWQGVRPSPGGITDFAFSLGVDDSGIIGQTMEESVRRRVVEAYAHSDYQFITPPPGSSSWADRLGAEQLDYTLAALSDGHPRSILEIGAGSAFVCKSLRQHLSGCTYTLIDPSLPKAVETGVEIIQDYFPSRQLADRKFDLILSFNCLEHVADPFGFMQAMARQTTATGRVVLGFPDIEAQFRRGDLNALLHEHLSYFTQNSARALFASAGFEVQELISRNDNMWCVLAPATRRPTRAEDGLALLNTAGLAFDGVLRDVGGEVRKLLSAGRPIAFHGATNGLNIFLHLLDLGTHPNVVIYDGDESKTGQFLPASRNPILHASEASYRDMHTVLVSAVSFFEPISRFLQEHHGFSHSQVRPLFQ